MCWDLKLGDKNPALSGFGCLCDCSLPSFLDTVQEANYIRYSYRQFLLQKHTLSSKTSKQTTSLWLKYFRNCLSVIVLLFFPLTWRWWEATQPLPLPTLHLLWLTTAEKFWHQSPSPRKCRAVVDADLPLEVSQVGVGGVRLLKYNKRDTPN